MGQMGQIQYYANVRLPTEKAHGIQIMKTCAALARRGMGVELVIPKRHNEIKDDTFDFYGVEKNFTLKKLWSLDLIWLQVPAFFKKIFFWLQSFSFALRARIQCRCTSTTILYTRDLPLALFLFRTNRTHKTDKTNGNNLFFEVHWLPEKVHWYHRLAYNRVKGLVVISEGIKKDLLALGIPKEKICVAPDAVDAKLFGISMNAIKARKILNVPADQTLAVYTGHLYEWKGADVLAAAAEKLKDVDVYIVGGTKEEVNQFRKKYRAPNLHIVGWRKHEEIPYWLAAADVLVLPNSSRHRIGANDTSPLKLFEYMMARRPIVASDVPAVREILDETMAELVKPDDPASLALGISAALQRTELSEKRTQLAYEKSLEFTWDKRAERIWEFVVAGTNGMDKTNTTNKTNMTDK